jgi:DNA-binding beta-propeller fold protein YncE
MRTKSDLLMRWFRPLLLPPVVIAALASVTLGCADREKERVVTTGAKVRHASIVRLDASSGRVKAVIPVGRDPLLLVPTGGSIWTLQFGDGKLARIDPKTNHVAEVDLGEGVGLASDGADVWVAANGNTLVRLDGSTGRRKLVLKLAKRRLFALRDAGFLIADSGAIWVTIPVLGDNTADQTLWRVDPRTGAVTARAPLLANPVSLAADGGRYIWVANIDGGKITRVDVTTNKTENFETDIGPAGVAYGAGSLWVSHFVPEVWRIDPKTAHVEAKIHIDDGTTRGIAFADGTTWVTTETSVIAIDPATNRVIRTTKLIERKRETGPTAIAYLDGDLWVSVE